MKRRSLLPLLLLLCCPLVAGQTLQDLIAEDQLRLRSWLEPTEGIAVGEEVQLVIEISTRRWFAGGTAIHPPEVDKLVILRRNQFATNLSRREEGSTWVVQQWSLELYPQREGEYLLPAVGLELAVNAGTAGIVRGRLETEPVEFSASIPELLRATDNWLATPKLEVSQRFDRELAGLVPGDAFEREITLRATHITSMMLPEPAIEAIAGLPAYRDNPTLLDRSNRGEAIAERIERITYVVEEPGQYQLPEQLFSFWDTQNRRPGSARLGAVDIDAGQGAGVATGTAPVFEIHLQLRWLLPPLLLLLTALLLRHRTAAGEKPGQLLRAANHALRRGQQEQAARLLYDWLNSEKPGIDWLSLRQTAVTETDPELATTVEELLVAVYAAEGKKLVASNANLTRLRRAARPVRFWRRLLARPARLELNPGNSAAVRRASGSR